MTRLISPEAKPCPPLAEFDARSIPAGEKRILDYQIGRAPDGTNWEVSILTLRGSRDGPTFLVNGGIHGDEYEGPVAIQELFKALDPTQIRGTWLGIPVLNEPAMCMARRCGKYDNQDLARTFPGKPDGTLTEQIAYGFGHYVLKEADYYVDLHSAGNALRMVFLSGYGVVRNKEVLEQQRRMAIAFGGELVWGTPLLPGRSLSLAQEFDIPAIYAETTGTGGIRGADVEQYREGIENVMRLLGMMDGKYPSEPRRYFRETSDVKQKEGYLQVDHRSPCKGLFLAQVDLWEKVSKGQVMGKIVDAAGRALATIQSRRAGYVILVRHRLSVTANDPLVVVVEDMDRAQSERYQIIPSAQRMRFNSTGSEAMITAFRVAKATAEHLGCKVRVALARLV